MSMLAERKQKQKWTLNPRGKYWSDDANKFGQRMLEKMGWSAGKGLGAKEDGITEHIKQTYKNDAKGIGYEDREDQWTKHEVDFTSLLQNLNSDGIIELKKPQVSLEKKSEGSKRRVHYHKFTRGKDLSRYSEKDLANIFGRKTLQRKEPTENIESNSNSNSMDSNKDFGVQTVHGGNMADYFKSKVKNIMTKSVEKDDSDNERPGFGFNQEISVPEPVELKENNKFKSFKNMFVKSEDEKKKSKTKVVINECFDNPGFQDFTDQQHEDTKSELAFDNPTLNDDLQVENKKSKKRKLETIIEESIHENVEDKSEYLPAKKKSKKEKSKKNKNKETDNLNSENDSQDKDNLKKTKKEINVTNNSNLSDTNIQNVDSNETKSTKKKKKGSKTDDIETNVQDIVDNSSKKKKKVKITEGIFNEGCTELDNEKNAPLSQSQTNTQQNTFKISENDVKSSSKKKKRKNNDDIINVDSNIEAKPCVSEKFTKINENQENIDIKTSSKKKKRKIEGVFNEACTELNIDESVSESSAKKDVKISDNQENTDLKSSSKKKKRKIEGIFNEACTELDIDEKSCTSENLTLKISDSQENIDTKSSAKKKKLINVGIYNVACTEDNIKENNDSVELSVPKESKNKKKKKSQQNGVENLACTANSAQQNIEETISSMSNAIDDYQLELENEMNEKKLSQKEENRIRFEKFNRNLRHAKKSIKDAIKGELRYEFEGSNLPQIVGYGVQR